MCSTASTVAKALPWPCRFKRRLEYRDAEDIGSWMTVLQALVCLSIITNGLLVAFSSPALATMLVDDSAHTTTSSLNVSSAHLGEDTPCSGNTVELYLDIETRCDAACPLAACSLAVNCLLPSTFPLPLHCLSSTFHCLSTAFPCPFAVSPLPFLDPSHCLSSTARRYKSYSLWLFFVAIEHAIFLFKFGENTALAFLCFHRLRG